MDVPNPLRWRFAAAAPGWATSSRHDQRARHASDGRIRRDADPGDLLRSAAASEPDTQLDGVLDLRTLAYAERLGPAIAGRNERRTREWLGPVGPRVLENRASSALLAPLGHRDAAVLQLRRGVVVAISFLVANSSASPSEDLFDPRELWGAPPATADRGDGSR